MEKDKVVMLSARMSQDMFKDLKRLCLENDISIQRMTYLAIRRQMAMVKFDPAFLKEQNEEKRD